MDAKNPASNNVPTPTNEEDLELVECGDVYCEYKYPRIHGGYPQIRRVILHPLLNTSTDFFS